MNRLFNGFNTRNFLLSVLAGFALSVSTVALILPQVANPLPAACGNGRFEFVGGFCRANTRVKTKDGQLICYSGSAYHHCASGRDNKWLLLSLVSLGFVFVGVVALKKADSRQ